MPIVVNIVDFQYTGEHSASSHSKIQRYVGRIPKEYELDPDDVLLVSADQMPKVEIRALPDAYHERGNDDFPISDWV